MTGQAAKPPQRVVSKYAPATELIDKLRVRDAELAKGIAELGDALHETKERADSALEQEHEAKTEAEDASGALREWRALLEDHRRGLVDRDELLEKTIGRA